MAVAVIMDFEGATLDQYDEVVEKMGLTPRGAGAPGSISHWVCATDGGIRVVDVWETKEDFERFAEQQIGPVTAEVGIPAPPDTKFVEVHSYMTAG